MMRSTVDLPEPFRPRSPIFAPWKNESEMSLMICRLGGTVLLTRSICMTYGGMGRASLPENAPSAGCGRPTSRRHRPRDRLPRTTT